MPAPPAPGPAAAVESAVVSSGAGDWLQFMGGADHAGYNGGETVLSPSNVEQLQMAWYAITPSAITGSAVVSNGVVYVGSQSGDLEAYPADCGRGGVQCSPLWVGASGGNFFQTPAVVNHVVYAVDYENSKLYAYPVGCATGGATCQPLWTATPSSDPIDGSVTVSNGVAYLGSRDGKIYAYDAAGVTRCSGTPKACLPLWVGPTSAAIYSTPAVADGVVYAQSSDGRLYAFAVGCQTGGNACTPVWKSAPNSGANSSPAVANGHVYVGTNVGLQVYAVGCATGGGVCQPAWVSSVATAMESTPAVANGYVYIGADNHDLYAFDANGTTGCSNSGGSLKCDPLWYASTSASIVAAPTVANGVVYVGSNDFSVYAYKADCGVGGSYCPYLWANSTGSEVEAAVTVSNGTLYFGNFGGRLYAYSLGSDWPDFQSGKDRNGRNGYETAIAPDNVAGLKPAWKAQLTSTIDVNEGSAVVSNGMTYAVNGKGHLYAYVADCGNADEHGAPATCSPVWEAQVSAGSERIESTPSVYNNRVYVASEDGGLYVYDPGVNCSGYPAVCAPVWKSGDIGLMDSSPVVANGVVYVGSMDGKLYAFDASVPAGHCSGGTIKTCTPLWTGTTSGAIEIATPAVANGRVYIGNNYYRLSAFSTEGCGSSTCSPLWVGDVPDIIAGTAVANGKVIVSDMSGYLTAFSADCATTTCHPVWRGEGGWDAPAIANGVVYAVGYDLTLRAYSIDCNWLGGTCSPIWTASLNEQPFYHAVSSPVVANGIVYVAAENGHLYAFQVGCATGGHACTPIWSYNVGGQIDASPAIANGALYIPSLYLYLWCFKIEGGIYKAATYYPIDPKRILDSRPDYGTLKNIGLQGKFVSGMPRTFQVAGATYVGASYPATDFAVPLGATAVTGNLTVTNQTRIGTVSLGPSTSATSAYTTINVVPGDNRANNVTVGLAPDGTLSAVYRATAGAKADVIFDVTGFFLAGDGGFTYHALSPGRILDSRPSSGGIVNKGLQGKSMNGVVRTFDVANVVPVGGSSAAVPVGAVAVTGNLTVTNATSSGYVAVGPTMVSVPKTSNINVLRGQNRANGVTVALNGSGQLEVVWDGSSGSSADLVFDVTGYFTDDLSGAHYYPIEPNRVLDTVTGKGLSGKFTLNATRIVEFLWNEQVPADATGISGNLTILNASLAGYAYVSPFPVAGLPSSSTVNVDTRINAANGFDVRIGSGGDALIWESTRASSADFQLDITGYWK